MDLLAAAQSDKLYKIPAPLECPKCGTAPGDAEADPSKGVVLSEVSIGLMELDAYTCSSDDCGSWVCAEGRAEGLVVLSPSTVASVTLVRHFASQVVVEGNPFSQVFLMWWIAAQHRRRAGVWSSAAPGRGRRSVSRLLSVGLRLMGKDTPDWTIFFSTCCDGDDIEVVTADGIWLGYLRRLLATQYVTYSEKCHPDASLLTSASPIGSESVRRFMRLALTEPGATISVSVEQRRAAALAIEVLLPAALPPVFLATIPADQKQAAAAIRALASRVWVLEEACGQLIKGVVGAMEKSIAAALGSNHLLPANAVERAVVASLRAWNGAPPQRLAAAAGPAEAAAGPVAGAVVAAAGAAVGEALAGGDGPVGGAPPAHGGAQDSGPADAAFMDIAAVAQAAVAAAGGRRPLPSSACAVLSPHVRALRQTVAHELVSSCVAIVSDPVVSAFGLAEVSGLRGLASMLRSGTLDADLPVVSAEAVRTTPVIETFSAHLSMDAVRVLKTLRMGVAFLNALKLLAGTRASVVVAAADCIDAMVDKITAYLAERTPVKDSAAAFAAKWCGVWRTREQIRAAFLLAFPGASEDPLLTGMYFPGRTQCRASAFQRTEKPDMGLCSKNYKEARKSFSPGAFIICCVCYHPKGLGFIVLDEREGPPALLDAIYHALLFHPPVHRLRFWVRCGAVGSSEASVADGCLDGGERCVPHHQPRVQQVLCASLVYCAQAHEHSRSRAAQLCHQGAQARARGVRPGRVHQHHVVPHAHAQHPSRRP